MITGIESGHMENSDGEFEIEAPARPWIMSDVFLVSQDNSQR
jgi:hypothetical protein